MSITEDQLEQKTITWLSDTLLPRVISGKQRLTDAQTLAEDAA